MRPSQVMLGIMLAAVVIASLSSAGSPACADPKAGAAPSRPAPSGPLKAYKGPEAEVVVMIEVNDGKEMLVHFKNVGKELDGKTLLYQYEDLGRGNKNVYINKKRGSKTERSVLLSARDGDWEFYYPGNVDKGFQIYYSEDASAKFKIEDVLNAYKP
jgi:hypothetical protein